MHQQEFIGGLNALESRHEGCVLTIGSFDGVHLGHKELLRKLVERGRALGVPAAVMIFEPQPIEYFAVVKAPARLMRLREKVQALFDEGVDRVVCLRFDARLRNYSAEEFVSEILVARLGVKHLEIGDDFRFGCDRKGDFKLLKEKGPAGGFSVSSAPTFILDGERVSSTRVRRLLSEGRLAQAESLLGHAFTMGGRVVYGRQLGRTLGTPTANVALGRSRPPLNGVFVVRATVRNSSGDVLFSDCKGVANVGWRPTLGGAKPLLEVHLLDFNSSVYGHCLHVQFLQKLRDEQKFASVPLLREQILRDVADARAVFDLQAAKP